MQTMVRPGIYLQREHSTDAEGVNVLYICVVFYEVIKFEYARERFSSYK